MIKCLIAASLGVGEIILIVACALIIISAVGTAIIRKVKGKPSCGGDCGYCERCSRCNTNEALKTNNKQK